MMLCMNRFVGAVSAINPFGPIFTKELRVTARRKRSYWLRVIYLGLLLLALLATFSGTQSFSADGIAARAEQQAIMGAAFFCCFSVFCIISMGLIAPVLTATSINSERLQKTLHVLLMTPIGNTQIVSGKLFSRLLVALTLIGLSLPVLALVRLLGGVELGQMIGVICICASFALSCASIGLFYSAVLGRAYAVILLSYATLIVAYVFLPMMLTACLRPGPGSIWIYCAANPVMCVFVLSFPERMTPFMLEWWPTVLVQLVVTFLMVLATALMLRRIARREGGITHPGAGPTRAVPPVPQPLPIPLPTPLGALATDHITADLASPAAETGGIVIAPPPPPLPVTLPPLPESPVAAGASSKARFSRIVSDNPVVWREARQPLIKKTWQKIAATTVALVLLTLFYIVQAVNHSIADADVQQGYAVCFCGAIWVLTAVLAATAIAQEKESDTWTLLLATPIRGSAVVWGKVLGILRE